MSKSVDDYIDAAKALNGLKSDNALARALNITSAGINHWRTKKSWPSDSVMISLATLSESDPAQALCDLNQWRAKSSVVANAYAQIAETLKRAAAIVVLGLLSGHLYPADLQAKTLDMCPAESTNNIYYGKSWYIQNHPVKTGRYATG